MKYIQYIFLVSLIFSLVSCGSHNDIEVHDNVLQLTDDNFQDAIDSHEFILVKFYAPWCGHCKQMAPHYVKAAGVYTDGEPFVAFGEVDSTVQREISQKFEVKGYPTLKFFVNGEPLEYTGGRDEDGMIDWIETKLEDSTEEVEDLDALQELRDEHRVLGFFYGETDHPFHEIVDFVSKGFDTVPFFTSSNTDIADYLSLDQNSFVLLTNFDEGRYDYTGEFNRADLKAHVEEHRYATVMHWSKDSSKRVFEKRDGTVFMILFAANTLEGDVARAAMKAAAPKFKGKIMLAESNFEGEEVKRITDMLNVNEEQAPCVRLVKVGQREMSKFKPLDENMKLTPKNIYKFYNQYKRRRVMSYLKSEPTPTEQLEAVVKVVANTYNDIVLNKKQDVLMKFYAPWCGHCKQLAPIWEELAQDLVSVNNLVIAKMDSTANEVKGLSIQSYPTLTFYPSNKKKGVEYEGGRKKDDFIEWLRTHTSRVVDWSNEEYKEDL